MTSNETWLTPTVVYDRAAGRLVVGQRPQPIQSNGDAEPTAWGTFIVMGYRYRWMLISATTAFPALTRALWLPQVVDVLRITSEMPGFDVVLCVDDKAYGGKPYVRLGPMLCLGETSVLPRPEKWPQDALLRLRPRIARARKDMSFGVAAERVVQWSTSRAFRAVRVKPTESLWVDHSADLE